MCARNSSLLQNNFVEAAQAQLAIKSQLLLRIPQCQSRDFACIWRAILSHFTASLTPSSSFAFAKQAGLVHSVCDLSAHLHISTG